MCLTHVTKISTTVVFTRKRKKSRIKSSRTSRRETSSMMRQHFLCTGSLVRSSIPAPTVVGWTTRWIREYKSSNPSSQTERTCRHYGSRSKPQISFAHCSLIQHLRTESDACEICRNTHPRYLPIPFFNARTLTPIHAHTSSYTP